MIQKVIDISELFKDIECQIGKLEYSQESVGTFLDKSDEQEDEMIQILRNSLEHITNK